MLFTARSLATPQIFVMDINGENKTLLGTGGGAVWSRDGENIAFLRRMNNSGNEHVFVMKGDGDTRRD